MKRIEKVGQNAILNSDESDVARSFVLISNSHHFSSFLINYQENAIKIYYNLIYRIYPYNFV